MRTGEIIRELARVNGISIIQLAKDCGYKTSTGLYNRLNDPRSEGMKTSVLMKILSHMDAELIIRDAKGNEWKVSDGERIYRYGSRGEGQPKEGLIGIKSGEGKYKVILEYIRELDAGEIARYDLEEIS